MILFVTGAAMFVWSVKRIVELRSEAVAEQRLCSPSRNASLAPIQPEQQHVFVTVTDNEIPEPILDRLNQRRKISEVLLNEL
jgi:hypothetical protein